MAPKTRDRILDASLRLFASRGVEGTKVTDIEAESGLSPGSGSFYRHFRSREDVLEAVVEREIERVRTRREGHSAESALPGDPRVALAVELTESLESLERMRELIALLGRERHHLPELAPRVRDVMLEGGLRWNADRIRARMDAGQIPDGDAEGVASVIMTALVGYHLARQYFQTVPGNVERARFVSALVDLVIPPER